MPDAAQLANRIGVGVDIGSRLVKVSVCGSTGHPDTAAHRDVAVPLDGCAGEPDDRIVVPCLRRSLGRLSDLLSRAPGRPVRVVVAGPDLVPGVRTEVEPGLRQALGEVLATDDVQQLGASLCASAAEEVSGDGPPAAARVVCHVGPSTLRAAVCVREGHTVRLLHSEPAVARETQALSALDVALVEAALAAAARAGRGLSRSAAEAAVLREQVGRATRAELVLERMRHDASYAKTPVFFIDPPEPSGAAGSAGAVITGAELSELFRPVARATGDLVDRLISRCPEPLRDPTLLLAGGFSRLEPIRRQALARPGPQQIEAGIAAVSSLGVHAAARGAARIAAGLVSAQVTFPWSLRLPSRRAVGGLLQPVTLDLVTAGQPPPDVVLKDGEPLVVTVAAEDPGPIEVLVRGSTGTWRSLHLPMPEPRLQGPYRVGVRPGISSMGLISFQPLDRGRPILIALGEGDAATTVAPDRERGIGPVTEKLGERRTEVLGDD